MLISVLFVNLKNFFTTNFKKKKKGEYVAPERLENIYQQSEYVNQILVHGDSLKDYLVAIVIPNKGKLVTWAMENLGAKEVGQLFSYLYSIQNRM
jgi:long-subunit acyl-CoA synthetase (AMP-forming)